jgi:hypothetical protein
MKKTPSYKNDSRRQGAGQLLQFGQEGSQGTLGMLQKIKVVEGQGM